MTKEQESLLVWLDLETTGLVPARDCILEVAIALARFDDPFKVFKRWDAALHFSEYDKCGCSGSLDPFIRDMHTKNGLLQDCKSSKLTIAEVEDYLLEIIPHVEDKECRPILAGSTIHFDHGFLAHHMLRLNERFSYRHYDVSATKLFCQSLGMPKLPKGHVHRAAPDIAESIAHAQSCWQWLKSERA